MTALISLETTMSTADPYAYVASVENEGSHAGAGSFMGSPGVVPGGVIFVPQSQAYYWTAEWQAFEKEADADIAAGRIEQFTSMNDAVSALRSPE